MIILYRETLIESTINIRKILTNSLRLFEIIDEQNMKIIEALYKFGPRNLVKLSRALGIPKSTLYNRIKKIRDTGVSVEPLINASNMGLKRIFAIIRVHVGKLAIVYKLVNNNPWCKKVAVSYEQPYAIFARFYVPANDENIIKKFLRKLLLQRLIISYEIYETHEELFGLVLNSKYIDAKEKIAILPWRLWFESISKSNIWKKNILPLNILEEPTYEIKVDKHDVKILEELEINAFKDYVELGKVLNLSPTTIKHHYTKHLIGHNIILGYVPRVAIFHPEMSKYLYGMISFYDEKSMLNFVNTLWNSPIMPRFARVLGDNKIIGTFVIPQTEEAKFLTFMEELVKENIVYYYRLYPIAIKTLSSWTIPAEMFGEHGWLSGWDIILKVIRKVLREEKKVYSGRKVR